MKNRWFESLLGYVKVEITGKHIEQFINRCIDNNIPIWTISRINDETISCYLFLKDVKQIRSLLKQTGCKLSFKSKKGLPFFMRKMRTRMGIVIGLLFFLIVIFTLSNMVWSIQISGASPKAEHEVKLALNEIGVRKGAFLFFLPSEQAIQQTLTEKLDDVTWIGVKLNGTHYSFSVVEKKLAKKEPSLNPRHLVAKKKAVIDKIFVEQGQAMVQENDYVHKGEVLVSGFIGKEENTKLVPAKAKVWGEVWYSSEITIPLQSTLTTSTGNSQTKHFIRLGDVQIPIWGFQKHHFENQTVVEDEKPLYLFKWKLPIVYVKKEILEIEEYQRKYTKKEAIDVAQKTAEESLLRRIPPESKIKDKKILHQSIGNGKVNLKMHYTVSEEISEEQAIIQGD